MMWKLGIIIGIICHDNIRTYHVCCMLLYQLLYFWESTISKHGNIVETLTMTRCETMLAMAVTCWPHRWMWTLGVNFGLLACGPSLNFGIHNQQKWNVWILGEVVCFKCFFQMGLKQPSWDKQHGILNHQSLD